MDIKDNIHIEKKTIGNSDYYIDRHVILSFTELIRITDKNKTHYINLTLLHSYSTGAKQIIIDYIKPNIDYELLNNLILFAIQRYLNSFVILDDPKDMLPEKILIDIGFIKCDDYDHTYFYDNSVITIFDTKEKYYERLFKNYIEFFKKL